LASRAGSLRRQDRLAGWLFGAARRQAHRTYRQQSRRLRRDRRAATERPEAREARPWDDLVRVLHEELEQLPHSYRPPLLACSLEGRTRDEAARDLGWSVGTLRRRLDQGRELLRQRMEARGAELSAGLLAAAVAGAAPAADLRRSVLA